MMPLSHIDEFEDQINVSGIALNGVPWCYDDIQCC